MLVCFDGSDGSGKSTQVQMLATALKERGLDPLVLDHPTHFGLGKALRNLLHVEKQRFSTWAEGFLYAADLAETVETQIKPALAAGRPVLMHRWWYSSAVYQAHIDGANWADIVEISLKAIGSVKPDIGFITLCDPEVAMSRITARGDKIVSPYENLNGIKAAYEGFLRLIESADSSFEPLCVLASTVSTPDEIHAQVIRTLDNAAGKA